jgi:dethiobiotin synthetase
MKNTWFVTGTDTGAGKTVFSVVWTRFLVEQGGEVIAVKPVCSGGREDAEALLKVQRNGLQLDDINPWHFLDPVSPQLAARRADRKINLAEVVEYLSPLQEGSGDLVIEGAGGLLSPLGEDFDNRDLLIALGARALVICPNRLGAINQARLVWESLPPSLRLSSALILNGFPGEDASTPTNREGLTRYIPGEQIFLLPQTLERLKEPLPAVLAELHHWTKRREVSRSG